LRAPVVTKEAADMVLADDNFASISPRHPTGVVPRAHFAASEDVARIIIWHLIFKREFCFCIHSATFALEPN